MRVGRTGLFQIYTKRKQTKSISFLCLLLIGIYGILFFLRSVKEITFSGGVVGIAVFLVCTGNWYFYIKKRRIFWCFYLGEISIIGFMIYMLRESLWEQMQLIIKQMEQAGEIQAVDVTELVLLSALILSFFLFLLEFSLFGHEMMVFLTMLLLLIGPAFGIIVDWKTAFVLVLFQLIFYAVHGLEKRKRKAVFLSVEQLSGRSKKAADAVSLSMAAVLVMLFCMAVFAARVKREQVYRLTYEIEGYVYRTVVNALGLRDKPVKDGKISRSNNHQMGSKQIQVKVDQEPTETIYLGGFYGEDYIGGDWTPTDNQKIYKEVAEELNWNYWENHMATTYSGMYYVMNSYMDGDPMLKSRTMQIYRINQRDSTYYKPYYSQWQGDALSNYFDYGRYDSGYNYRYYEQKDMAINWFHTASGFQDLIGDYLKMQEAYKNVAKKVYTQVPEELLPRLTQLCQENEFSSMEEITAFILYTLHSQASYTLTPGMAPYGEDIIEYFLFENGRGYCVHFAAAAALMYRMYGIPARYVSGYMIEPLDFKIQSDGSYLVEVTDKSAHAWVEVFLDDYGWTPIEVTPAAEDTIGGNLAGGYPGLDLEEINEIVKEYGWEQSLAFGIGNRGELTGESAEEKHKNMEFDFFGNSKKTYGWMILVVMGVFFIPLGIRYRKLCRQEQIERMKSRAIFFQILRVLRIGGVLLEYEGGEADFAVRLEQEIGEIGSGEMEQMMEIVNRAAYGTGEETGEESEYVRKIYQKIAVRVYEKSKWWKRWMV